MKEAIIGAVIGGVILIVGGFLARKLAARLLTRMWTRLRNLLNPGTVIVAKNEDANSLILAKKIRAIRPRNARLIEYSSMHAQDILAALKEVDCHIQLLVRHPDVVSDNQKERIYARLSAILDVDFRESRSAIEVKCYKAQGSLRGRVLDERLVNVGWFTPTYDLDIQGRLIEVYGHSNPVILADAATPEGQYLVDMFGKLWKELWESKETESALEVLQRHSKAA